MRELISTYNDTVSVEVPEYKLIDIDTVEKSLAHWLPSNRSLNIDISGLQWQIKVDTGLDLTEVEQEYSYDLDTITYKLKLASGSDGSHYLIIFHFLSFRYLKLVSVKRLEVNYGAVQ